MEVAFTFKGCANKPILVASVTGRQVLSPGSCP